MKIIKPHSKKSREATVRGIKRNLFFLCVATFFVILVYAFGDELFYPTLFKWVVSLSVSFLYFKIMWDVLVIDVR